MRQAGMTLIELLVVVVVASIIGIALVNMFVTSNRTFMDQNNIIDVQRDGRLVIEYVTRALREAGLNPYGAAAFERIRLFNLAEITIDRDADLDGVLDDGEIVAFKIRTEPGGEKILMRGFNVGSSAMRWQDIAGSIVSFNLDYFDETGGALANTAPASAIRSIDVTIDFQDTKFLGGDFTRTYKTRVDLRNF